MIFRIVLLIFTIFSLIACTVPQQVSTTPTMGEGKIQSLKDGSEINFKFCCARIMKDGEKIEGINLTSGEKFFGDYYFTKKSEKSRGVITNSWGLKTGEINTTSGAKQTFNSILKGDKGTIIDVTLDVDPVDLGGPWYGEAVDNTGVRYKVFKFAR